MVGMVLPVLLALSAHSVFTVLTSDSYGAKRLESAGIFSAAFAWFSIYQ